MNAEIAVFIDFENLRRVGAQLYAPDLSPDETMVCPSLVADLICSRRHTSSSISQIVVVRGEPSRYKEPHAASRFKRDADRWLRDPRVRLTSRPLRYGPRALPKESGIDLRLGLDFVEAAKSGRHESVILLSGDSDFGPALDDATRASGGVEIGFWASQRSRFDSPLAEYAIREKHLWAHRLSEDDFWDCVPTQRTAA